jgi:hypothetical protein
MKAVVLYEMAPGMMSSVSAHVSAHRGRWQAFAERGDPFVLNGLVQNWYIREWQEVLVPEPSEA